MFAAHIRGARGLIVALTLTAGCQSATEEPDCRGDATLPLAHGNCLVFENAAQLGVHRETIERIVPGSMEAIHSLMPIDNVAIIVTADSRRAIRELGIGGSANSLTEIRISVDPNSPFVSASLQFELFPLLAHELHHTMRHRTAGYGSTLFTAMISEGLADHFAMEVAGIDPPIWSEVLVEEDLQFWIDEASPVWSRSPYNHNAWFFGEGGEIPRWTGYSMGFEMVRRFLEANPDRRPSELFSEPGTNFLPGQ